MPIIMNTLDKFWSKVNKTDSCWLWTGKLSPDRYGTFNYLGKRYTTHRLSWIIHNGLIPKGKLVLHICDNPPCINPSHLYLGSYRDNAHDFLLRGRKNRYHLTIETARKILESKESYAILATRYGVHESVISSIKRRRSWRILDAI